MDQQNEMKHAPLFFVKAGRFFYGIGITAFGIQQIIIRDFRPEILPPFPDWAHHYTIFPLITGAVMIIVGIIISGLFTIKAFNKKDICLYLGFYFLALILFCHLPYNLIFSPNKAIHLGVWAPMLKEVAYTGGAFVMAGSFQPGKNIFLTSMLEKLVPLGRIFFSITMILYGCSHFVYTDYVSAMVPKWFGMPIFWTYVGGTALIAAGIAIAFKIFIRRVAYLLAAMLFLWFIFLHVPDAVQNPHLLHGNEIVSAFDALLFCGVALLIANKNKQVE